MTDEERKIFEKYIRPGRRLLSRIKTRLIMMTRSKRIKTLKDVDWMNQDGFMKILCFLFLIIAVQVLAGLIWDAYLFLFPQARPPSSTGMTPYIIPMMTRALGVIFNI